MSDPTPPLHLHEYGQPPSPQQGIRTTDYSQSKLLMRAIKTFGKPKMPKKKKGLISNDQITIKHKTPKFW